MNKCDKCVHNGICTRQRYWSNGFESDKDKIENCDAFLIDLTCKTQTNFDKITSSAEVLAGVLKGISDCRWINCHECPLSAVNCSSITSIKEWLQKECEDG